MKITAIKAQVKHPDRVSIAVDGVFAFSLHINQLLEERLTIGQEIDGQRLNNLKKTSDYGKLYDRLLRYALLRPHSQREMRDYCRRHQFDSETSANILAKLSERGYVNDVQFARAWVASRQQGKPQSLRRLQQELQAKGVARQLIQEVLTEVGYDDRAALSAVVAKKSKLSRYQKDPQKLIRYLVSQGFTYDAVREALVIIDDVNNTTN